jgi:hypothetical protein
VSLIFDIGWNFGWRAAIERINKSEELLEHMYKYSV